MMIAALTGCMDSEDSVTRAPVSFLLTWQSDPTSTMTIDWHPEIGSSSYLEYREEGVNGWREEQGQSLPVPGDGRRFKRSELTGLEPGQSYEFRFSGVGPVYRFRTMPADPDRPVRFLAGGDMMHFSAWMRQTALSAMQVTGGDIDFAVIGGDLAYANGEEDNVDRWYDYFQVWSEVMVTDEGRAIPHLAAIGNHEVKRGYLYRYSDVETGQSDFALTEAPNFSAFVPHPGAEGYGVLDFGDYLSLFLLDSGHLNTVGGQQTEWLEHELSSRGETRHMIPVYHIGAWPSVRHPNGEDHSTIRDHWVPLFEEHGVRLAFEHHDHTYKRTHPIRDNQIDEDGIHYIGDGAWGVWTYSPRVDELGDGPWYMAQLDSIRHFIVVEIEGDEYQLNMYDEYGRSFDELEIEAP